MNNQNKAREIADGYDYTFDKRERDASYYSALEIAEWKDNQFKEYLEKKKEELEYKVVYGSGGYYTKQIDIINEIINELFKED